MGFFDTVARLTITEVFKAGLAEVNSRLNPDEMIVLLQQAEVAADKARGWELFARIDRDGANGYQKFLKFFQSHLVQNELHKPFQNRGKPDVNILIEAFKRSASEHPESENYLSDLMPLWMEAFVESYFEQVGICFQVAKEQYLKQLARRVDDVKFVGIAVPGEEVEKQEVLAQIFVMPDVREERSKKIDNRFEPPIQTINFSVHYSVEEATEYRDSLQQNALIAEQKEWAMRDRSAPRIPAPKILDRPQKKAVILGTPGSGKTILVSYFALMLCQEQQSDPTEIGLEKDADWLPVVVRIRDWILQPNMGLLNYLRWDAEENLSIKNLPQGFFEHWLDRGRALILLDGLDEVVNEAQQRKVAEDIRLFLNDKRSDNPVVITSRPVGYRRDLFKTEDFTHYTLEAFDDKQMTTFINHWYDSRIENKAQGERRKAELQKAFDKNDRIKLLATNPLLLTIITLIHRDGGELPIQRYELYETAIKTLLISWDRARDIKLYEQVLLFLNSYDLLYLLKKLAYWIHTQGTTGDKEGGTLIKNDELFRQLWKEIETKKKCEPHEAKEEASRFIDFIRQRTGLLNEQGRDRYAFVHKTFQEYLTAEEIFDRADVEDDTEIILDHFRQHLHDQHWREVLLLLVSKLKGKKAQKAIQAVLDAGSEYEQWLHRDLLFAGWCLTEDPPELSVVAADWVGEILDRLVGLEVGDSDRIGWKIRGEVEKILHCFGETTVERVLLEKLQAQGNRIDTFRLLEFQAALGHEAESIDILLFLLRDPDPDVRASAATALNQLGKASPEVINSWLSFLDDKSSYVRYRASTALVHLGNTSPEVMSCLLSLLRYKQSYICHLTANALGRLGNTSPEVVSILLSLLDDKEPDVRSLAATALGLLENANLVVVSGVVTLLNDRELGVRYSAAVALGQIGNANPEVVSKLLSLLNDESSDMRSIAAAALVQLGDDNPAIESVLLSLLDDKRSSVRHIAVKTLGELGNVNLEVFNGLLSLLGDEESVIRSTTATALGQLGNSSEKVINRLLSLLCDVDSDVRYHTAKALGQLGNISQEVVMGLKSLLNDEDLIVRYHAASALSQLAKISDAIRPEVVQWLEQNPNDDGIGNAIDCLWSIVVE
jgi:HEAT repeat protein